MKACSDIDQFVGETGFQKMIDDNYKNLVEPSKVRKVIFCSG